MGMALPKERHRPYRRGVSRIPRREEALSPGLRKAAISTALALIILLLGQVVMGKIINTKEYWKGKYSTTQKVLKEENAFLKGQLSDLLSPVNVEKIAKSRNMKRATIEYFLTIGEK
ncbi:hypothetical protein H5T88_03325 [bacterium]|nr:hypothetical protein [bacterium]